MNYQGSAQLRNYFIAFCQNIKAGSSWSVNGNQPFMLWAQGATKRPVTVPTNESFTLSFPADTNDVAVYRDASGAVTGSSDPVYSKVAGKISLPRISASATDSAQAFDSPYITATFQTYLPVTDPNTGASLGKVAWSFTSCQLQYNFVDWVVTYNASSKQVIPLQQGSWTLNANSASFLQGASASSNVTKPSAQPVTGQPFCNVYGTNLSNGTMAAVGNSTSTIQ